MSYDIYLNVSGGGPKTVETFWRNHTSNTAAIWRTAGCDLAEFDGRAASTLAAELAPAIDRIKADPERYRIFEPDNGWGTYETTLAFLEAILEACRDYPAAYVSVSR